jgi:hypothetical protein
MKQDVEAVYGILHALFCLNIQFEGELKLAV